MTRNLSDCRTVRHAPALTDPPSTLNTYIHAGQSAGRFRLTHSDRCRLSDESDMSDTRPKRSAPCRVVTVPHRSRTAPHVAEAAQAEHGDVQKPGGARWKQTERRLRRLVREQHATHEPRTRSDGQFSEGRYYVADVLITMDTAHGQGG
jgi:hypothetical protein